MFDSPLWVRVRHTDREEYQALLQIKISLLPTSQSSSSLTVELTDGEDPFFIYAMECSEADYHILKTEQQIMVDFQSFPAQFVELLQMCGQQSQFVAILEVGVSADACFKIVQQNAFKASDHLRLRFSKGNDEAIKKYLAHKLKTTEAENVQFRQQGGDNERTIQKLQETNE